MTLFPFLARTLARYAKVLTPAELIANATAIDDAWLAINELKERLNAARGGL